MRKFTVLEIILTIEGLFHYAYSVLVCWHIKIVIDSGTTHKMRRNIYFLSCTLFECGIWASSYLVAMLQLCKPVNSKDAKEWGGFKLPSLKQYFSDSCFLSLCVWHQMIPPEWSISNNVSEILWLIVHNNNNGKPFWAVFPFIIGSLFI